jgi:hypothetical protein
MPARVAGVPRCMGGIELTFSAIITRSDRDETFGFAKRRTKVTYATTATN